MPNRLATASSPYLRMHAGNPVDWQPWDDMALKLARETDTPILLSIGYSACHWCHVMAHECFEDPDIADAMNHGFVNIKLDREERPDIDRVYQLAHQALSGHGGGWPLTVFLDPQTLSPFYIGTYFPPTPRHGLPGFPEVLQRVRAYFDHHRDEFGEHAETLRGWLQQAETAGDNVMPDADAIDAKAMQRIAARFDADQGGSRGAPKFPRATELEWLLDVASEPLSPLERGWGEGTQAAGTVADTGPHPSLPATFTRMEQGDSMARLTLASMASRGLQDHLGGGFFRYCVDADWTIPHFEKMLYDNAQLLPVYARLARAYEDEHGARLARAYEDEHGARLARAYEDGHGARLVRAREDGHGARGAVPAAADGALRSTCKLAAQGIVAWLARDMTAPNGAFYSAISADSDGEEGRFYLWTREQLRAALPETSLLLAGKAFGFDRPPNFEGKAWHLLRVAPLDNIAWQLGRSIEAVETDYDKARHTLFDLREKRNRPLCDDKILTAWNALAISGLARSARWLDDAHCADMATRALAALRETAWIDGELFANAAAPAARIPGFLDDHAFLLDALLETLQLAFDLRDLAWAAALADALLAKFEDRETGGFWFSTSKHATPLARGRSWIDDATPNGNGVAIRALSRLGHLVGDMRYLDAAERALRAAAATLQQYPEACCSVLQALREFQQPRTQIVVRCASTQITDWQQALHEARHVPGGEPFDAYVIPIERGPLPGLLAAREPRGRHGAAYVCAGLTCQAPITSPGELAGVLRVARPD